MAYSVIWLVTAQDDVRQILDYLLDAWSSDVADRFAERVVKVGRQLETFPYSGTRHPQLSAVRELRVLPYHSVFYTIVEERQEVLVLNVFDQRRK